MLKRFGGNYCLHLQGRRVSSARTRPLPLYQSHISTLGLLVYLEYGGSRMLVTIYQTARCHIPTLLPYKLHKRENRNASPGTPSDICRHNAPVHAPILITFNCVPSTAEPITPSTFLFYVHGKL
jgi:hypothetical protein